jgi:hypothetical protein
MNMLRPAPQPISEVCLSIDVGSVNAGICLFDGAPSAQRIMWLSRRQLLDVHAKVVHDYHAVIRHLDAVRYQVETLLQGRHYWVLVEQQFFDSESKAGLVFTLQLEAAIAVYFRAHKIDVRLIQATKRFPFLGLEGWAKDTRYLRKKRVVARVKELLNPTVPGNKFGQRPHNLEGWTGVPDSSRHDMADAIAQCLHFYYRNLQAVQECTVAPAGNVAQSTVAAAAATAQGGQSSRQRAKTPPRLPTVKGKLEQTLAQLGIRYRALVQGESSATTKLFKVWEAEPNNPHLVSFLSMLADYNGRGNQVTSEADLEERLTPVLT